MMKINVKRIYEEPAKSDGFRVLVDRVWPRGLTKDNARIDLWLKEIGPTNELRQWFGHEPAKWARFKDRYFQELDQRQDLVRELLAQAGRKTLTLLYGAKNTENNQAVALREYLEQGRKTQKKKPGSDS
jgi:uncharacterized protein YeaO (DUF488 family)